MKRLLIKEFVLAAHETTYIFLALSAMLLIPNYPYYVVFFYTTLGIYFTCLTGRENHDIYYSALLPVPKRDIVRARMGYAVILELAQMALAIPFAMLRTRMSMPDNQVGMEANVALFGLAAAMLGVFNFLFFTRYYRDPNKPGKAFVVASTVVFVYVAVAEACAHAIPFMRDVIDTRDPANLAPKCVFLLAGLAVFAGLTFLASRRAMRTFEALDL